jgi:tellurite resistance protein TerC
VTRLGLVLIAVEGTDVIFALDSIPAILAITTDSFIVFTSNIFAILGLRSLYFILEGMIGRFRHLQVALAFVLVFIGVKMLLHDVYTLPNLVSLGVILGAVSVGVLSSLMGDKGAADNQKS